MKKARRARPIRVPPSPNPFPIALISDDQLFQRGIIKVQLTASAQSLYRPDEHEIGCARAETWRGRRRQNEKFAGLEVGRRLQADLGEARNRIMAALRHLFDLLEDQAVVIFGERCPHREPKNHERNPSSPSLHDGISKRQNAIWQWPLSFLNVAALAATRAALSFRAKVLP